jgi:hypothetical protein
MNRAFDLPNKLELFDKLLPPLSKLLLLLLLPLILPQPLLPSGAEICRSKQVVVWAFLESKSISDISKLQIGQSMTPEEQVTSLAYAEFDDATLVPEVSEFIEAAVATSISYKKVSSSLAVESKPTFVDGGNVEAIGFSAEL